MVIAFIASKLVPLAMRMFGTVIPGVGTMHLSFAAVGLAAILQKCTAFAQLCRLPAVFFALNFLILLFSLGWKALIGVHDG